VVQLCAASLHQPAGVVDALGDLLSDDERARVARFRFAADRRRFTVARGFLRQMVGTILSASPRAIRFVAGVHGKPFLEHPREPLQFNVSHSDELAVYAFAWDVPVGVDVERVSGDVDWQPLAARFLGPSEQAAIRSMAPEQRQDAFFSCWTRKEAFVKALGAGLSCSPQAFTVSADPAAPPRVLEVEAPVVASEWSLVDLRPAPRFRSALAAAAAVPPHTELWAWQPCVAPHRPK